MRSVIIYKPNQVLKVTPGEPLGDNDVKSMSEVKYIDFIQPTAHVDYDVVVTMINGSHVTYTGMAYVIVVHPDDEPKR